MELHYTRSTRDSLLIALFVFEGKNECLCEVTTGQPISAVKYHLTVPWEGSTCTSEAPLRSLESQNKGCETEPRVAQLISSKQKQTLKMA